MQITLTARKMELTDSLRSFAEERIKKAGKFLDKAIEARVVLSVEKQRHSAEVTISADKFVIHTKEISEDMYNSIDKMTDKIEILVKKHKERQLNRKNRKEPKLQEQVLEDDSSAEDDSPQIVSVSHFNQRPMSEKEAAEQLHLSENIFFVYRNIKNDAVNVMYKKNDGDFGLIEP